MPGDEKHVMYVWVDALTNYLTAAGFPDDDARKQKIDLVVKITLLRHAGVRRLVQASLHGLPVRIVHASSGATATFAGSIGVGYGFARHFSPTPPGPSSRSREAMSVGSRHKTGVPWATCFFFFSFC